MIKMVWTDACCEELGGLFSKQMFEDMRSAEKWVFDNAHELANNDNDNVIIEPTSYGFKVTIEYVDDDDFDIYGCELTSC